MRLWKSLTSHDGRVLIACAAAFAIANAASWLQPILLVEILAKGRLSEAAAGLILATEMLTLALSAAVYARLCRGMPFRKIGIWGTIVAALGNLISLGVSTYGMLLAVRALCGLGEGALLMISSTAIARFDDPDREYGKINVSTILSGTVLIGATSWVGRITGGPMTYPTLLMALCVLMPMFLVMPAEERLPRAPSAEAEASKPAWTNTIMVLGVLILAIANAAIWSFCFVIGGKIGLSLDTLNHAMIFATIAALGGSCAAGIFGNRFGRVGPLTLGITGLMIAGLTLTHTTHALLFEMAMALYLLSLYFILPYFYGSAAAVDTSGQAVALMSAAFLMSFAIGPYFGGLIADHFPYTTLGWIALGANIIAYTIMTIVNHMMRSPTPTFATAEQPIS